MDALESVVLLVAVAAITPGPNNFIVMDAGARRGALAAGQAMAGVVLGSLALLALVAAGLGPLLSTPPARVAVGLAAGAYMAWLGVGMIRAAGHAEAKPSALPRSMAGVAVFQLSNPKAWTLVAAAAAALGGGRWPLLAAVIAATSVVCLSVWALAGAALARALARPTAAKWFHRSMGGLMAVSAFGVIFHALA
jgi:threonine/homoserine/homoserine lactone efflux protein